MKNAFSIFATVALACSAHADLLVAPNDRATQSGNTFVLDGFSSPGTLQNVYGKRNFSGPVLISSLAFRMDEGRGGLSFSATIPKVTIRATTYAGSFATYNPGSYDRNKGPDSITVYDAPVQWSSTDQPGGAQNPFDLKLLFSTPFLYDPSKGALLIEYSSQGPFNSGFAIDAHGNGDDSFGWMASGFNPAVKEVVNLVTQFEVTNVPEPTAWGLLLGGGALLRGRIGRA